MCYLVEAQKGSSGHFSGKRNPVEGNEMDDNRRPAASEPASPLVQLALRI